MPHLNYEYKLKKKEERKDFQAIFMVNQNIWEQFKKHCENQKTTPSQLLREFINNKVNSN